MSEAERLGATAPGFSTRMISSFSLVSSQTRYRVPLHGTRKLLCFTVPTRLADGLRWKRSPRPLSLCPVVSTFGRVRKASPQLVWVPRSRDAEFGIANYTRSGRSCPIGVPVKARACPVMRCSMRGSRGYRGREAARNRGEIGGRTGKRAAGVDTRSLWPALEKTIRLSQPRARAATPARHPSRCLRASRSAGAGRAC